MTPDQSKLERSRLAPRSVQIARLLFGLRNPLRFMMSGAHPDDECSPLMAALWQRDGFSLSYSCSTRGEGGQNDIGTEHGAALGALRTAEMEAACDILSMRLYWLSEGPDDDITDWRLSKTGVETLEVWGHERTLARMVHILRRDRPDVLCPTFLDVPGQHGHHRAMTQIAHEAFDATADLHFDGCDLPVWEVAKLYLPAWSGAGRAYDDDLPPPPATITVAGASNDPITGWSAALIGGQSHACHRSQGMGRWPEGPRDFNLHLAKTRVGPDSENLSDNLPGTWADIGFSRLDQIAADLPRLIGDPEAFITLAREGIDLLAGGNGNREAHAHRIEAAQIDLARSILLAEGTVAHHSPSATWLRPSQRARIEPPAMPVLPEGWSVEGDEISPTDKAMPVDGYRDHYDPSRPPLPATAISVQQGSQTIETVWSLDRPVIAGISHSISLSPASRILNSARPSGPLRHIISDLHPAGADISLCAPQGWTYVVEGADLCLSAPEGISEGRYSMPILLDGEQAFDVQKIDYPHIRPTQSLRSAVVEVSVMSVAIPDHPIAYIGAGLDRVPEGLRELGMQVDDLSGNPSPGGIAPYRTILIGIHAFGFNQQLAKLRSELKQWVRDGGNLVTLYHRPWDGWEESQMPLPLEIGQPSLRWRVTNKDAPVQIREPDHPIFTGPNAISCDDFNNWHKERGLYFAKTWDKAYRSLVAMNDPGESPLEGGLLSAEIGKGRHSHVALNLHHQLERKIPGAIRLLVNILAPAG